MEEEEEERAPAVPSREGKAKSRWRRGAPAYTSFRKLYKRTRRRLTDMLERDHMSTKHGVSFLVQNAIWPRWPEVPHYFSTLFFNGVPFSFEARLTGTVCRENMNYSTTTLPLVLVSKKMDKIYKLELQRFLAKGFPLASHTTTLSLDLKKMGPLSLLTGGHISTGDEKDVQR